MTEGRSARRWVAAVARWGLAIVVAGVLAALAVRNGSQVIGASIATVVLDAIVGLAFVVVAASSGGPVRMRALMALVGFAWLAGGVVPVVRTSQLGFLFVALATFPSGRLSGVAAALVLAAAVVLATAVPVFGQILPAILVAASFGAIAVAAAIRLPEDPVAYAYPLGASTGVAIALLTASLPAYLLVTLAIAVALPIALRAVTASRAAVADRVLSEDRGAGLAGLAIVLGDAIGDRHLRIERWDDTSGTYVDALGRPVVADGNDRWLPVDDRGRPLAVVAHRATALEDPPTAAAVRDAVRLAAVNERLQQDLDERLLDLEAARARLLEATDDQRAVMADRLRIEVVDPIRQAVAILPRVESTGDDQVAAALWVVHGELAAVADELIPVVAGLPPVPLGEAGLAAAVRLLADRSPVPLFVTVSPGTASSQEVEAVLFYVCSEAITNAVKHSEAARIDVEIDRQGRELVVRVTDDGRGGADPRGSGLQGLADRLQARGGRLRVESPPGAGTVVVATLSD